MPDEVTLGTRVGVASADMKRDLGLGTYLGEVVVKIAEGGTFPSPKIILDSGFEIFGFQCNWAPLPEEAALSNLALTLKSRARLFEAFAKAGLRRRDDHALYPDDRIVIEGIELRFYDHRKQAVGKITYLDHPFYVILAELELRNPEEELVSDSLQ